jgi:hypothetical protein
MDAPARNSKTPSLSFIVARADRVRSAIGRAKEISQLLNFKSRGSG